jgi:hypothetical protein
MQNKSVYHPKPAGGNGVSLKVIQTETVFHQL